jgi:hypothetical protein
MSAATSGILSLHEPMVQGNTVVVEHSLEVIKTANRLTDLGPEDGDGGGRNRRLGPARGYREGVAELHGEVSRAGADEGCEREAEARDERGGGMIKAASQTGRVHVG